MECIICAIAKQENKYLYEWALYHLDIGFTHIILFDNNDINGESVHDVFTGTPIYNKISIVDVRGERCYQLKAYNYCYHSFLFDWCAFIDIDEFITFNSDSQITNIEQLIIRHQSHNAIALNWLCYGDSGKTYFEDHPVLERFKRPIHPLSFVASQVNGTPENYHIKLLIKAGLDIDWEEEHYPFCNPHVPARLSNIVSASGIPLSNSPWQHMDYYQAYIRHYITKSLEEYSQKQFRGAADTNSQNRYFITRYFRYNTITPSKISFVKRTTGKNFIFEAFRERFKWWSITRKFPTTIFFKSFRNYSKTCK